MLIFLILQQLKYFIKIWLLNDAMNNFSIIVLVLVTRTLLFSSFHNNCFIKYHCIALLVNITHTYTSQFSIISNLFSHQV